MCLSSENANMLSSRDFDFDPKQTNNIGNGRRLIRLLAE